MTTRDIQRALMFDLHRRATVCPNFTPKKWWEADVFELTAAGYFREYEIKMSRADFKADARKIESARKLHTAGGLFKWVETKGLSKHQRLQMEDTDGPNHFYFVTTAGLISHDLIPQWAGLIEATPRPNRPPWNVRLDRVKAAPRLHRAKVEQAVCDQVKDVFYYRFQNLFLFGRDQPVVEPKEEVLIDGNAQRIQPNPECRGCGLPMIETHGDYCEACV